MFHLGVINNATVAGVNCKAHDLHLNSRGERNRVLLIAKRLDDDHVLDMSSVPVFHQCKGLSFLTVQAEARKCLRYIDCKYLDFEEKGGSVDALVLALFIIVNKIYRFVFCQNVRGLGRKLIN